ncbi:MAG: twin-arginine translocase TatA/TatE family subunit [Pseudolysinimonas sp.]
MLGNLTGWHLLIIVAIVLLLFGATRLPALARSIGQSTKIFREEIKSDAPASDAAPTVQQTTAPSAVVNPPASAIPIPEPATSKKSGKPGKTAKS